MRTGDPVRRLRGCSRGAWRVQALFATLIFSLWSAVPVLRAQVRVGEERVLPQAATQKAIPPPSVIPNDAEQEAVPAPSERSSEKAQNPQPLTQASPNTDPNADPNAAATYQPVTWKNLPVRILGDQRGVWLFPLHLAKGEHWLPFLGVTGTTGGLIAADPHIMFHLRNHTAAFDEFGEIFSSTNTAAFTALVPATFYFYGLIRKSSYSEQTALLTGEAVVDSEISVVAIKLITRRLRPNAVAPTSDFSDTFFKSPAALINKGGSFPSGHAAAIFSVATVVAERYRQHRWVPWVVYGLAASISFSRVPTFAHFPSDVFLGAALGYTITRFDVLRSRTQ
jgi:membrane-associated phospholipid phosphatase